MESLVEAFSNTLGQYLSREAVVFIISMVPVLELRGGLLAAKLLDLSLLRAIPICILGNIIPIPFILLFVKRVFAFMKRFKSLGKIAEFFEKRAEKRSGNVEKYEFLGLALFVGIPLPMTGAWTGSLIAAMLNMDFKRSILTIFIGIIMATVIMSIVAYGLLGLLIG